MAFWAPTHQAYIANRHMFVCENREIKYGPSACICVYIYIWPRLKNIGLVTGPGGLFATRLGAESGGLATNPPCDKPIEDFSTLHRVPNKGL